MRVNQLIKGMTLIETLIASVILFMAVAIVSVSYSSVIANKEKINAYYQIAGSVKTIRNSVILQRRNTPNLMEGQGGINGIDFVWKITEIKNVNSKPWQDIESGMSNTGMYTIQLLNLELELSVFDANRAVVASRTIELNLLDWQAL